MSFPYAATRENTTRGFRTHNSGVPSDGLAGRERWTREAGKLDDPDACTASIPLAVEEAGALASLLGAPQLVAQLADDNSELGVVTRQLPIVPGSPFDGSPRSASRMLEPLRDLFAAMFFVVFGLSTDPRTIPPVLLAALGLAVVTTATKVFTGWFAAKRQGIGRLGRARAGAALVARGEFSIVIAGRAVSAGAVDERLAALATAYVLVMAILGPLAARVVEPVASFVVARRTRPATAT